MPPSKSTTINEKWTITSLKEYFEMRFDNLEKNLNERFAAPDKAIAVIEKAVEDICNDIKSLELTRAELAGKANQSQVLIVMAVSMVSLVVSVVGIVLRMSGR
jgi:hypothetical protein